MVEKECLYLNVRELSKHIKLSKSSIYKMVMRREIPFIKATGTLLFKQDVIDQWLSQHSRNVTGGTATNSQILKPRSK
jgi:excisionase family DNA binding protein